MFEGRRGCARRRSGYTPPMKLVSCLALTIALAAGALPADAAPGGALATLKKSNDEVRKLLKKKAAPGSAEEKALRGEIKKIVNGFIDYGALSQKALAGHWAKISGEQQKEFVEVLRDLIESNYVKQIRSNASYEVAYKGEDVSGDDATVHSTIKVERKGRSEDMAIDYKMSKANGRWVVWDVITEDVSLVRNYRKEFNKAIDKEGFEGLLKKMKKKLAEQTKEG